MGPSARILPDGNRMHLQHGPIDLVIGVDGDQSTAFRAAHDRFATILDELVAELPSLRSAISEKTATPKGTVARRMHAAALPHSTVFVTPMAAVAGAVADEVLAAMRAAAEMSRAYVNNGGDIALHLTPGTTFTLAMQTHAGEDLGRVKVGAEDNVGGIATSARHGRSLSMGIADSVTILAASAAQADIAATLVANEVDLANHPAIQRRPACDLIDDTDLGDRAVVVSCGKLSPKDSQTALQKALHRAEDMRTDALITDAALFLQGAYATTSNRRFQIAMHETEYA